MMRVAITSIISQKEFGTIFSCRIQDQAHAKAGELIRVRAMSKFMLGQPVLGELWDVEGELRDTHWGPQIDAQKAVRVMPTGKLITSFLSAHAPGVGPDRAAALWQHFGLELNTILSDEANIPAIAAIIAPDRPNLAPRLAASCVRSWKEAEAETGTLLWLAAQGIEDIAVARRVAKMLGIEAVERLRQNPYVLVPLLSWRKVDSLGLKLLTESGVTKPSQDVRRLVGACDAVVKAMIAEGHTAGTFEILRQGIAKHLGVVEHSAIVTKAIEAGKRFDAIKPTAEGWRAPGCASMEDQVLERLLEIASSVSPIQIPPQKTLERLLSSVQTGGRPLHQEQREAVLKVVESPLACLQGGAGVGKTTTTQAICNLWERLGGNLVLTAIAGKAALQLSRSTGRLAMTVARLRMQLGKRETIERELLGDVSASERKKLAAQLDKLTEITESTLVVVDEASMLDLTSANVLLHLMPKGARLLLVGDEAQLPPVGFGLIYHRLVEDDMITARLTVIHRQTEASGIPVVAAAIRAGNVPVLTSYVGPGNGVSLIECAENVLQGIIRQVWGEIGTADSLPPLVVTAANDGDVGIHALNTMFHSARIHRHCSEQAHLCEPELKGYLGQWFSPGDPVVFLRNDYAKGLFNGLLGSMVDMNMENRELHALFDGYDEPHLIDHEELIDLQLAYAITCHRAQGSQAPTVIVPLYKTRVLDPSWLYTAVTRAERQVVLIGSKEVLIEALASPRAAQRRMVGFRWK